MKLYPVEFYVKTKSILVECGIENKYHYLILIFVSSVLEIFGIGDNSNNSCFFRC